MIREYLKIARSFNSFLTGIAPVMGAIAMGKFELFHLSILFLIGFFGHTCGFVLNDIFDYKIDKLNKELKDRPLISGTISIKKAWIFAIFSLITAFLLAIYLSFITKMYFPLIVLFFSAVTIIVYDLISKKFPLMDIFDAGAVFLLILYGAITVSGDIYQITILAWIVCLLGTIQVFFMQLIPGGLKDTKNDYNVGANTVAVKLGVRVTQGGLLQVPLSYKALSYFIQIVNIAFVFLPFIIVFRDRTTLHYIIWVLLGLVSFLMLFVSHKFMNIKYFERGKMRKLLGSHFSINFALVPIMLMALNPWTILIVIFPPIGFISSNLILHGTFLQPKTM
ncbi:MAG: UbiA prenyltransferase family protein [Thermoplasmatales archaeon]|nr:UbiA prenyltransferase family protein [Thermoplasmatales archaeon]